MYSNYFKTAIRNLFRNRSYSLINLGGLAIGLAACLLVGTVVRDDLSYDTQWTHSKDIYRIISLNRMGSGDYERFASAFGGLGPQLAANYPEVEGYSMAVVSTLRLNLNENDPSGVKVETLITDTAFSDLFDVQLISGDPNLVVTDGKAMLVTESFRKRFFPNQDPVGRTITDVPAYSAKPAKFVIAGVIRDLPANTHLRAAAMVINKRKVETLYKEEYGSFRQTYILLKPGTSLSAFTDKVNKWYKAYTGKADGYQYEFQPLRDIYLHSNFGGFQKVKGSIRTIYIFSGVALLILFIACINFVNLTIARSMNRFREAGVRKVLGAGRRQIINQFLSEAILLFAASALIAVLLYKLALPMVESFLGHSLSFTLFNNWPMMLSIGATILVIALASGIYPASLLARLNAVNAVRPGSAPGALFSLSWWRKGLVVLQFSISIVVLLAMIVVKQQVRFMEHRDIGFNKDHLLNIGFVSWDGKGQVFKQELLKQNGVKAAAISSWTPSEGAGFSSRDVDDPANPGEKLKVWYINGDIDLAATLGLQLKEGRMLSRNFATDQMNEDSMMQLDGATNDRLRLQRGALITETTAKLLGVKVLGQGLSSVKVKPVGIVADFHNQSLREALGPVVVTADQSMEYGNMLVRVIPGHEQQVMNYINKTWKSLYPGKLLEMQWVNEMLARQYETEDRLSRLFGFFSSLAMILAALGILGLIIHAAGRRIKEIGIRKVLGASTPSVIRLLTADFLKLVLLAVIVAAPVGIWLMHRWLLDFAFRISISWWMAALAGSIPFALATLTIGFLALRAARSNPVQALRNE